MRRGIYGDSDQCVSARNYIQLVAFNPNYLHLSAGRKLTEQLQTSRSYSEQKTIRLHARGTVCACTIRGHL
jgi:hypothetical protein